MRHLVDLIPLPRALAELVLIAGLFRGTLAVIDLPTPERMAGYSKDAYRCSPLRADQGVVVPAPAGNPIPAKVGAPSPIKHCIYIIKENRTYDQVFGDIKEGNGDRSLCIFPEKVTPNHHKLVRQFGGKQTGNLRYALLLRLLPVVARAVINIFAYPSISHNTRAFELGEVTGDARLPHAQNLLQLCDRKLFLLQEKQQTKPRWVG